MQTIVSNVWENSEELHCKRLLAVQHYMKNFKIVPNLNCMQLTKNIDVIVLS